MHRYDIKLNEEIPDVLNMMYDTIRRQSTVLEIGCGNGRLTRRLKAKGCRVSIIEKDPVLFEIATKYAEDGFCGDAVEIVPAQLEDRRYDYIVFADVLEHLAEPEKMLVSVRSLLSDGGRVLISLPNFAHNDILLRLYDGTLSYTDTGLMDRTHLRVFTYEIAKRMFETAGYFIVQQDCVSRMTGCTEQLIGHEYPITDFLRSLEERKYGNVYQYYFVLTIEESDTELLDQSDEHADIIERRIFFDRGDGYSEESRISVYARKSDLFFDVRVDVPDGVKTVRFDPVMNMPCAISNLRVASNNRYLQISSERVEGDRVVLRTMHPSIYITDLEDVHWIAISGEIEYDYNYLSESRVCFLEKRLIETSRREDRLEEEIRQLTEATEALRKEHEKCEKEWHIEADKQDLRWREELKKRETEWKKELLKQEDLWLAEKEKQVTAWKSELKKARSLHQKQTEELQQLVSSGNIERDRLKEELKKGEDIKEKLSAEIAEMIEYREKQKLYITRLEESIAEEQTARKILADRSESKIEELEKHIREKEDDITTAFEDNAQLKTNLEAVSEENGNLKTQIAELQYLIEQERQDTSAKMNIMEEELARVREVSEARDANIQHLQRVKTECNRQIEELRRLISVYENSTSWRVTEPFRRIMMKLRGICRPERPALTVLTKTAGLISEKSGMTGNMSADTWDYDIVRYEYRPLVTVIVPNYNHGRFLRERLESIYCQTYENTEVILLDDCSTDDSKQILTEYAHRYPEKTRCFFNDRNSGKIMMQWNLGITQASGELIWIAESDDFSERDFLEIMVGLMARESVQLAFCRSDFVQDGRKIWDTEQYLADISCINWDCDFVMTADEIMSKAFSVKNIIPNVSSAVFRNIGGISDDFRKKTENMKLSSDWMFYLELIRGGTIAYTRKVTNFYRVHEDSTSLRIQQTPAYYEEYEAVLQYMVTLYDVPEENFEKVRNTLKEHYRAIHKTADAEKVDEYFSIERIKKRAKERALHVIMTSFSMQPGGGEMYAIYLANEMRRQGLTVTLLNLNIERYVEEIRNHLYPTVPLVNVRSTDDLYHILYRIGGDIIHTHHGSSDQMIACWLAGHNNLPMKHVITLHGMYEMMSDDIFVRTVRDVDSVCRKYIYIADKNLEPFKQHKYYNASKFVKITNGLPKVKIRKLERSEFGLLESDFVVVLASRGIPEKGWLEAVEAVKIANASIGRRICLLILGDGEMKNVLQHEASETIRFLGVRSDVRDFYAMADVGLVPTWFKGESCPLVIIECLQSGTPVIATDIAEVRNMLSDEQGELAGKLLDLRAGKTDPVQIAAIMRELAVNRRDYQIISERVRGAARKFNIEEIVLQYQKVYEEVLTNE